MTTCSSCAGLQRWLRELEVACDDWRIEATRLEEELQEARVEESQLPTDWLELTWDGQRVAFQASRVVAIEDLLSGNVHVLLEGGHDIGLVARAYTEVLALVVAAQGRKALDVPLAADEMEL